MLLFLLLVVLVRYFGVGGLLVLEVFCGELGLGDSGVGAYAENRVNNRHALDSFL